MEDLFVSKKGPSFQERKAILAFLGGLQKEEGEGLERLVLFGSKARKEATQDSVVDLLAIIKKREIEEKIYEEVARILSSFGIYLSVKTLSQDEFKRLSRLKTPFMENIKKEGVILWPKP